jgi:hypothetical protein
MLKTMAGSWPSAHTIDYVEGVSHDDQGMFYSEQGIEKVVL